ncbi:hypothetical protein PPERSA_04330 [Pseudocohnilembus persalinus]|uniref:Uncharacterized protein n=1 Tax=Pseudocohnilembus persalinus TaxID=266149 RepID=A0A0V0QQF5_PSEPJ|nr:hypothetical protein PPERSA_04330 [Pseudocohnilembus persalinus]|eukprot:KRX04515.1 hypothetical protein PPERSA_04330 [Pseudocohnilembus persalinus]
MNKKKQFIKKGTSLIVSALNNPVLDDTIKSKLLLNLAVSKNFFDYPQKEAHEINQEFKKYLVQNQKTESNIDNLFQSIKNNRTFRKDEPKMAIQMLQFQYELAQKQKKNQVQSIILYSSYFIDNKFYDQAEKLLLGVSKFDTFNKYKEDDFHTLFDYKKNIYDYENPQNDYNQAFSLALLANMYDLLGKSQQRDELIFVKKMFQMHCQIPRWTQIQTNQDLLQIHTIQKQDMQFKTDDLYEEYSLTENYENEDKYNEEEFEEFMRQYKLNQQNY